MGFDVERLLNLWTVPLPGGPAAEDRFRTLYTDPVIVNGAALSAADIVARARSLQQVFQRPEREVLDLAEADGKVAVAFRLTGRQVGPLNTSAGVLPPTCRTVSLRVIDILTLT